MSRTDKDRRDEDVERFLDHLYAERGLSTNTVAAYRRDLALLRKYAPRGSDAPPPMW